MTPVAWSTDELDRIGGAEELEIAARRRDGSLRRPVPIWVVRVGDELFVRSWRGPGGSWYRTACATHEGHISGGGVERDVSLTEVGDEVVDAVDAGYRSKYGRYPSYVEPMIAPQARARPRSSSFRAASRTQRPDRDSSPREVGIHMKVAVLGTGMVGRALAARLTGLGHDVVIGTRDVERTLARTEPGALGTPPYAEWQKANPQVRLMAFPEAGGYGEVVINATEGDVSLQALEATGAANLAGKVVIDLAIPLDFSQGMPPQLHLPYSDSLGERIQSAFPDAPSSRHSTPSSWR